MAAEPVPVETVGPPGGVAIFAGTGELLVDVTVIPPAAGPIDVVGVWFTPGAPPPVAAGPEPILPVHALSAATISPTSSLVCVVRMSLLLFNSFGLPLVRVARMPDEPAA